MSRISPIIPQRDDPFETDTSEDVRWFHIDTQTLKSVMVEAKSSDYRVSEADGGDQMALVPALNDYIAFSFQGIPEVERIYARRQQDNVYYVRVAVKSDSDAGVRHSIYSKEQEIIKEFEMFDFDFDILLASDLMDQFIPLVYQRDH
ncbi:MAG TPA: hypothetical protein VML01_12550 [Bryobacterales bacterium]|nr:hypothetical protein [Bryobacterales bacterium]